MGKFWLWLAAACLWDFDGIVYGDAGHTVLASIFFALAVVYLIGAWIILFEDDS